MIMKIFPMQPTDHGSITKVKITRRQLRRLIRGSLLEESTLLVTRGGYGYIGLEDDENEYTLGEVVAQLLDANITNIFHGANGMDEESLQSLLAKRDERVQGGIERWDSDVFEQYYNLDPERIITEFAGLKGLEIKEASEEDDYAEYPEQAQASREAAWEEENY